MTSTMEKAAKLLMIISMITNLTLITVNEAASLDVSTMLKVGDQSIHNCALTQDCDSTRLSPQSYESYFKADKDSWGSLGLNPHALQINQISVGFVPPFQEQDQNNAAMEINKKLFKPMSIVGDYIALYEWDYELKAIDWHLPYIKQLEGNPVWCITLMPKDGLWSVTPEVAQRVANKLSWLNQQGIPVWLKFMYEMNGNWNAWGMKPKLFKEKWELMARAVKSTCSRTYMLWSPNALFGKDEWDERGGYLPYWPKAETVDIVGISFYHWGKGAERVNIAPTQDEAVAKLVQFAKIFGPGAWNKPVVVSETAASFTYYEGTSTPVGGGADEITIKMTWVHLLLDRYIKKIVPGLKAIIWFEIVKKENATGDTPVRTEDFRLVMGNPDLGNKVRKLFENYAYEEKKVSQLD